MTLNVLRILQFITVSYCFIIIINKKKTTRSSGVVALQISEQFGAFDQKTSLRHLRNNKKVKS